MATFDHRKYLIKTDAEPSQNEIDAFEDIVADTVDSLRNATREDVNIAINELLQNPNTKAQVGDRLVMELPAEIEKRLEK